MKAAFALFTALMSYTAAAKADCIVSDFTPTPLGARSDLKTKQPIVWAYLPFILCKENTGLKEPFTQAAGHEEVVMHKEGGVYVIPVRFNGMITLNAIIDSGASDVVMPADVVLTLMRTKTISDRDFIGQETVILADGSKAPSTRFKIRSLEVGRQTFRDVTAAITNEEGQILLGQSFLERCKRWSVDYDRHILSLDCGASNSADSLTNLLDEMQSSKRWAVGGRSNCSKPKEAYALEVSGGSVVWRNGEGDVDVEAVSYSDAASFNTITRESDHGSRRPVRIGQSWTYERIGADRVRVRPSGGASFLLVRCP
jgi:hypothetical protein